MDRAIKTQNGFISTKELLKQGIHQRDIKSGKEQNTIVRIKRGCYRASDVPVISYQGFADLTYAVPEGVVCLLSALSYYELTTFNPSVISMAICRGVRQPKIEYPPVKFYHFSSKQFKAGIDEIKTGKYKIKIYCPEKTICDCFRYRNKLGIDMAKEGLDEYLKRKNRDLEKLLYYAEICRVKPLMRTWLEAMV